MKTHDIPPEYRWLMHKAATNETGRSSRYGIACQLLDEDEGGAGTFEFRDNGGKLVVRDIALSEIRDQP
jgi:hypothetical protein